MSEMGEQQPQVADLVGELVKALSQQNHRRISATVYVNLIVGIITILTVVFYGGAMWQRLNDHESRIQAQQIAIQAFQANTAVMSQLSAQVAAMQAEVAYMRQRQDKLIDQK